MTYRERATGVPGVVLWSATGGPSTTTILPDGCLDLIWDGARLFVAGPDTRARRHVDPRGGTTTGLRFSHGRGPSFVGAPADALVDDTPALDAVWAPHAARALADRVADAPAAALLTWVRGLDVAADRVAARVFAASGAGRSVAGIADELGCSPRTLHRRCLPVFGYGPQHLGRVLRLGRALAAARASVPWAEAAAGTGYADQGHLARDVRALTGATPTALLTELSAR